MKAPIDVYAVSPTYPSSPLVGHATMLVDGERCVAGYDDGSVRIFDLAKVGSLLRIRVLL